MTNLNAKHHSNKLGIIQLLFSLNRNRSSWLLIAFASEIPKNIDDNFDVDNGKGKWRHRDVDEN